MILSPVADNVHTPVQRGISKAEGSVKSSCGIIVIGRNEGERLERCLRSVEGTAASVVYVDSGSTDRSADIARGLGAVVIELDHSIPFTAARARNEGFTALMEAQPGLICVQFIDGDCEIAESWIETAAALLEQRPDVATVCGRLRERDPEASIYNALCDLEWDRPAGETNSCGGVCMIRAAMFEGVGGFDPTVPAGEEPELCQRLRERGWKIIRLSQEMATHDAAMMSFRQWWRRQVRGGYSGLDVCRRFGKGRSGLFAQQIRSTRLWTIGWIFLLAVAVLIGWLVGGGGVAAGAAGLVFLLPLVQTVRIAMRTLRRGYSARIAVAYGWFMMIGKWAQLIGQVRHLREALTGRPASVIEHKRVAAMPLEQV